MKKKELWVIKSANPNNENGRKFSDYSYAQSMKKYLERMGKEVVVESIDEWDITDNADVVVFLRGYKPYFPDRKNEKCIYILWVLSHPDQITDREYNSYDVVCVGTKKEEFLETLSERVHVPMEIVLMCTDSEIFFPGDDPYGEKEHEWIFVGNSKWIPRKSVIWSIKNDIPLEIWGKDWDKIEPDLSEYVVKDHILNDDLPELYRNSKITVNDHYDDMTKYGFINTRILESLCCGLPIISDYSQDMEKMFGDAILYYNDEESFCEKTQYMVEHYDEIKEKVMDISQTIRKDFSFEQGMKTLDFIAEKTRKDEELGRKYLAGKLKEVPDNKTRVMVLFDDFKDFCCISIKENEDSQSVVEERRRSLQRRFWNLSWRERKIFEEIPEDMKENFYVCLKLPNDYELEIEFLNDQIKELERRLQRTREHREEINNKLQITYDEKFERGLKINEQKQEIKNLKKELGKIKKSRSYKLARVIAIPIRVLRKIRRIMVKSYD